MAAAPRHDPSFPPIDFPFFGLAPWSGPTWVELFEGAIGHPMTTLWLGHRIQDSRAHVSVGTNNERLDWVELGQDLAFGCLFALSERMRPDSRAVTFPVGFNKVQLDHVEARSQDWRNWPTVSCTVDGAAVTLSYWRYAWGWAGFICDVGEAGIKLVGVDVEPATIRLETVREPANYGFDPTRRLVISDLHDREDRAADACLPLPWADTMHADQRALIERHGLG